MAFVDWNQLEPIQALIPVPDLEYIHGLGLIVLSYS